MNRQVAGRACVTDQDSEDGSRYPAVLSLWRYPRPTRGMACGFTLMEKSFFENAPARTLFNVELWHDFHLRWPDLDIDLEVDALRHPEKYPLRFDP
jgi:hypothetical protein